ncbi:MAG: beta-ketoacyl-[acyl-carrier-protein] synthase family protein [Lentisphaerae bacterium]|nr:beta-ketoacyl-[acyl-carrier-protein] synthase family protein [Lentisphaerota bacterium]
MEHVFISGRGIISPLGNGLAVNEKALREGISGITTIADFVENHLESTVGGLPDHTPDISDLFDRKALRFAPPVAQMSIAAVREALAEAGIAPDEAKNYRIAVISGIARGGYRELFECTHGYAKEYKIRCVNPFSVPRVMPSNAVSNLSICFGITGESYDISAACASSAIAIIQGTRLIRSGEYDMVIAGGAEHLDWVQALGFNACRALSKKYNDTPERASRPFDRDRDGFVIAGGAAYVLLESESSLKRRSGKPITLVSGVATNSNAKDMVVPDATGGAAVMRAAVANAKLSPADIGYINTHGTGTPVGDPIEMAAIYDVFGTNPAVNSTKSQTGHMVGATGAAEVIFTSLMLEKNFLSPSLNLENPDPEFSWADFVRTCRTGTKIKHALSNSFAFGGSNAAIVLSKL